MPGSEGGDGGGRGWAKPPGYCEATLYVPATFYTTSRFIAEGSNDSRLYLASAMEEA